MIARGCAAALLAASVAAGSAPAADLPERPLAAGHPCRIEDARFSPFHEEHGVTVGLARLPGGAVVLRARTRLDAPANRVAAILEDVARWPLWIKRLRSFERLPGEPPAFAAVFAAPWPLREREYALAPATARDGDAAVVFWEDASTRLAPPGSGRVRVAPVSGCFSVSPGPVPGGATLVYTESGVFGESLPAWMRGAGHAKGPVRLLDGLRARLREN
ncbi:MAG: hypothetical protein IPL89_00300 [Acidobacteria bacterium]|nr:hypothetical protein [Acidobacteriota bacterium]